MIELFSIPVEQSVLSTLMTIDQAADEIISELDVSDFYAGKHQIIFATSMVDEDLNGTELVIGDFHDENNKTLKNLED